MPIIYDGNRVVTVSLELADAFEDGDRVLVLQDSGELLHIPAADWLAARGAVDAAASAFSAMSGVSGKQVSAFFLAFAHQLEGEDSLAPITEANARDVAGARERGRSTTRLVLSEKMLGSMVEGLLLWANADSKSGQIVETVNHPGWRLEEIRAGLGVVGFVFEGRPNVLADACGVLRSGNSVVIRIGSDALGTARAIMEHAVGPALDESGLPPGAVALVDTPSRAAAWAMFSDRRLSLAVARGSGAAVSQLGAVARQAGTPVSLHGTGGAWIVAAESASADGFASAVYNSLDRKVCNTVNTVCIVDSRADALVPVFLDALDRAGARRNATSKLHITKELQGLIPPDWFEPATIVRAEGPRSEPRTEYLGDDELGIEWEWEDSPEVTLTIFPSVEAAIAEFNRQSPRFIASLVSSDADEQRRFFEMIDAPFVGNGFTRWVDGQYALHRPELGLSNWQTGRLLGRGGILSGESAFTLRTRAIQEDPDISR